MEKHTEKALRILSDHFICFSRNGRWGTCAGCPQDAHGNFYPELCKDTDRYDHHLTAKGLADIWDTYNKPREPL